MEMAVYLLQGKVESFSERCQDILLMKGVSIKDLGKLLETLSSTALAIIPRPLNMRYLQRQKIHNLCLARDYNSKVSLDSLRKEESNWWISNLSLSNGRSVISCQMEHLIQSDVSNRSWWPFCLKTSIEGV